MSYVKLYGYGACKEIVDNIPDRTATHYTLEDGLYHSVDFISVYNNDDKEWYDSDYASESDLECDYKQIINLNTLKNEIEY